MRCALGMGMDDIDLDRVRGGFSLGCDGKAVVYPTVGAAGGGFLAAAPFVPQRRGFPYDSMMHNPTPMSRLGKVVTGVGTLIGAAYGGYKAYTSKDCQG